MVQPLHVVIRLETPVSSQTLCKAIFLVGELKNKQTAAKTFFVLALAQERKHRRESVPPQMPNHDPF